MLARSHDPIEVRLTTWLACACVALVVGGAQLQAQAQAPPRSLSEMALLWSQGHFATPLICTIDGRPVRGLRRLSILPGKSRDRASVNRMAFVDLEIAEASRCFTELDGDTPNIEGWIELTYHGRDDTVSPRRAFREQLKRKKGFEFRIRRGHLRIRKVAIPPQEPKIVDFSRGRATIMEIPKGADRAKLLAPYQSPRNLQVELEARDGTTLSFALYLTDPPESQPRP